MNRSSEGTINLQLVLFTLVGDGFNSFQLILACSSSFLVLVCTNYATSVLNTYEKFNFSLLICYIVSEYIKKLSVKVYCYLLLSMLFISCYLKDPEEICSSEPYPRTSSLFGSEQGINDKAKILNKSLEKLSYR